MAREDYRDRRRRGHLGVCALLAITAALTPFAGAQAAASTSPAAASGAAGKSDPALRSLLAQAIRDHRGFEDRFHAEVWLTDMSNRLAHKVPDPARRIRLLKIVHVEAVRAKLPPELVLAVIDVESDFKRFAISRSGALGLMQVMPFWLKEIGRPHANLFDPQTNLRLGCTILRYYLDKEHGDLRKALARYNGSAGKRVYPDRVFTLLSRRWFRE
ncbi:MAG TPA: transglycosylase SLT domain-containing protein [Gammaproteobacteria bacterium]|nr:transglycosylase SLT domain-containing protein [Gammaproteobacteria bacterium]